VKAALTWKHGACLGRFKNRHAQRSQPTVWLDRLGEAVHSNAVSR
jgi:hypothetical protein